MSDLSRLKSVVFIAIVSLFLTACGGTSTGVQAPPPTPPPVTPPPPPPPPAAQGINTINHIVFMFQENRSFDHYFGKLGDYRVKLGLPPEVDGIPPQGFTNPADACTGPNDVACGVVTSFHQTNACLENTSPSWNEHHVDYNRWNAKDPAAPALQNGFVKTAAGYSQANSHSDDLGTRAMGYYTEEELNYYYFMAATFATSDRWFSPAPARSPTNRDFGFGATSEGIAYGPSEWGGPTNLKSKHIFQLLDEAGITWKVYHVPQSSEPQAPDPATYFLSYSWSQDPAHQNGHWVLLDEYFNDLKNGTLPQVALVESASGLDEHPGEGNILRGQAHVASIINALMQSSSWKDSVFILTYDEMGGLFDHVPPISVPSPDGIKPFLAPGDIPGDFTRTGMRIPLMVVSPWVKKNYVSHTPMDFTAILKLIETRFKLPNLTARDAAQPDMTEFFDFSTGVAAYATAPKPPDPRDPASIKCSFVKPKDPQN
jgi:phospholipase C